MLQSSLRVGAAIGLLTAGVAHAAFVEYVIRGTPTISHPLPGQTEIFITASGQKVGLGSNEINGTTLGNIASAAITRLDDVTRFAAGSGPRFAPYLNIWITDGSGRYAVVANEPTNPDMQGHYANGWDLSSADLANTTAKVYENADLSWLPAKTRDTNGDLINDAWAFSDLFAFEIEAPSPAQLAATWPGLGTGAPREFGTNLAYGVNWVFGDTLSNYISGDPGYLVSNPTLSAVEAAVPVPATIALAGLALLALRGTRRATQRT